MLQTPKKLSIKEYIEIYIYSIIMKYNLYDYSKMRFDKLGMTIQMAGVTLPTLMKIDK